MKVYGLWHRCSHDFDDLQGLYSTEEAALNAMVDTVWSKMKTPNVNLDGVKALHSWVPPNVTNDDPWETMSIEEIEVWE